MSADLAIIKPDGTPQRVHVELTAPIANAIVERILQGLPIYADEQGFKVLIDGQETEISKGTLNSWVTRDNVIPETGRTLREVLDEARIERKRLQREALQQEMIENAETALAEIVKLPIKTTTVRKSYGIDRETGKKFQRSESVLTGVDAKLADVKVKGLSFALERLNPERYSQKSETRNLHMVFSLSDLRRAKERRDELVGTE